MRDIETVIEAYGMKTKVWCFKEDEKIFGCDECCNKDRETDCDHYYRKDCPHCNGKGWIPLSDVTCAIPKEVQ